MPAIARGGAILRVQEVPSVSCRASKLNAYFVARVYRAQPGVLTANIPSYATKRWDTTKRKTHIKTSDKNIHWSEVEKIARPGEYYRARSNRKWGEEMQVSTEIAGRRQEPNASRIRNVGPWTDSFLTIRKITSRSGAPKEGYFYGDLIASQDDHKCAWSVRNTPKPSVVT